MYVTHPYHVHWLKCYARAERSHGNYSVHSEDLFLLRSLLCHCFSWTKSLQLEIRCFTFHFLSRIWIPWSDLLGIYFGVISWVNWSSRQFLSEEPENFAGCQLIMTAQHAMAHIQLVTWWSDSSLVSFLTLSSFPFWNSCPSGNDHLQSISTEA